MNNPSTPFDKRVNDFITFYDTLHTEPQPPVALTPRKAVWRKNKATLYRYQSNQKKKFQTPIFIVYALINKPYILDLSPQDSLIQTFLEQGHDVFLLDWGVPGYEDASLTLDTYVSEYIKRAFRQVLKVSKAKEVTMLGYCMGGTMTAMFASAYPELPIKNIIFLTTPFDFSHGGMFSNWLDERYFNLDKMVDTMGLIPAEMIDFGSKLLKPLESYCGVYLNLQERIEKNQSTEKWKLMQRWVNDGVPFAGEAFRQWIRDFYQENKLIQNQLTFDGRILSLKHIKANVLLVAAKHDHIVTEEQTKSALSILGSKDKTYEVVPTGHISVVIGKKAHTHTFPLLLNWLQTRSN